MSHVEYFNIKGYFNSLQYSKDLGVDLTSGTFRGIQLSSDEKKRLEDAIALSDKDSQEGKLTGIVNLIEVVENIQDKYGVNDQCPNNGQSVRGFLEEISTRKDIVDRYGLKDFAEANKIKPRVVVGHHTEKKTKCGGGN